MRIARWAFTILAALPLAAALCAGAALAQDQQDSSLAAAARRTQDQKKDQPKAAKVWDNDNIPSTGAINVVGQQQSAGGPASEPPAGNAQEPETKPAPSAAEVAGINADVSALKQRLAGLKAGLDIAQRKYTLDEQSYLSNPNRTTEKAGAAASLAVEKSDLDAKTAAVADAEKALAAAQSKLDEATKASSAAAAQEKAQAAANSPAAPPANPPQAPPAHTVPADNVTVNPN